MFANTVFPRNYLLLLSLRKLRFSDSTNFSYSKKMKLDSIKIKKKKKKKKRSGSFRSYRAYVGNTRRSNVRRRRRTCRVRPLSYRDISYLGAVGGLLRYAMRLIVRYSVAEKRGNGDAIAGERLGRKIHSYKSDCSTGCDGFLNPVISATTILRFLVIVPPFFSLCAFHVRLSIVYRILTTRNETNRHCVPPT